MAKTTMRAFRGLVRKEVSKAMGMTHVHRIRIITTGLTASSTVRYTLLKADDEPDYDLLSDGTNIAECETGSRIVKLQLTIQYYNSTGAGNTIEMMLYKNPDGEHAAQFTPANLFEMDYQQYASDVKKYTAWYMPSMISANFETVKNKVMLKRGAFRRIRGMHDLDTIELALVLPAGTTQNATIHGRIWTRK